MSWWAFVLWASVLGAFFRIPLILTPFGFYSHFSVKTLSEKLLMHQVIS